MRKVLFFAGCHLDFGCCPDKIEEQYYNENINNFTEEYYTEIKKIENDNRVCYSKDYDVFFFLSKDLGKFKKDYNIIRILDESGLFRDDNMYAFAAGIASYFNFDEFEDIYNCDIDFEYITEEIGEYILNYDEDINEIFNNLINKVYYDTIIIPFLDKFEDIDTDSKEFKDMLYTTVEYHVKNKTLNR